MTHRYSACNQQACSSRSDGLPGRIIGVLQVASGREAEGFDVHSLDFMRTLATQTAAAVANAQLYYELRDERDQRDSGAGGANGDASAASSRRPGAETGADRDVHRIRRRSWSVQSPTSCLVPSCMPFHERRYLRHASSATCSSICDRWRLNRTWRLDAALRSFPGTFPRFQVRACTSTQIIPDRLLA